MIRLDHTALLLWKLKGTHRLNRQRWPIGDYKRQNFIEICGISETMGSEDLEENSGYASGVS